MRALAQPWRNRLAARTWTGVLGAMALSAGAGAAAPTDVTKLPPPASVTVDYARDVQPIFEAACVRCHVGERPKSRYSLGDRDSAIKGGALGQPAIVPGDSAASPLVHYVARLVEDLEMPPTGKGEPLTRDQIALLRAWIDQGAKYPEATSAAAPRLASVTPMVQWLGVDGNAARFREHAWLPDGAAGGIDRFEWQEPVGRDGRLTVEGRGVFDAQDYRLKLSYDRRDAWFARAGFEQFRRWYDDAGGQYAPFGETTYRLGRDLHLDTGKAWFEIGLNRPALPKLTLGYEYHFREGERATLQWGGVYDPAGTESRNIFPAARAVDEQVHVVRFDLRHEVAGFGIENQFRGEFADLRSRRENVDSIALGAALPDSVTRYRESFRYFEGANVLRIEKPVKDWLFFSGGFLYSNLDGDGSFSSESFLPPDPAAGPFVLDVADELVLRREAYVFNANSQLGPWRALTLTAGVQADWSRQEGFGRASFGGFPTDLDANLDRFALSERASLKFTGLPYTVVYADLLSQQENAGQYEQEFIDDGFDEARDFLRDTDADADLWDVRTGFTVSPWARVSFDASYRHRSNATRYDSSRDTDGSPDPGSGYPAFIRSRDWVTDEVQARLVWQIARGWKATLKYQFTASDIETGTDGVIDPNGAGFLAGGRLTSGRHDAHVYSVNVVVTPWRRLYLSTAASISDARTTSRLNTAALAPYEGQIYTLLTSATYALDAATDLNATYAFSKADYAQGNAADGLPLGLVYDRHSLLAGLSRRLKNTMRVSLSYGFFRYEEPTLAGAADYTAHGVFAWLTKTWR